ncbi:hypothetical protein GCM10023063_24250 [Arthrobacter methylotrophus]
MENVIGLMRTTRMPHARNDVVPADPGVGAAARKPDTRGPSGTGKTLLLEALGQQAIDQGMSVSLPVFADAA